jgi:hypothetical protein
MTYGEVWGDIQTRAAALRPTDESRLDITTAFTVFNACAAEALRRRFETTQAKTRGRSGLLDDSMVTDFTLKVTQQPDGTGIAILPENLPNLGGAELEVFTMCKGAPIGIAKVESHTAAGLAARTPMSAVVYHRQKEKLTFFGKQMLKEVLCSGVLFQPIDVKTNEEALAATYPLPLDLYSSVMDAALARILQIEQLPDDKTNDEYDNSKKT